MVLRFAGTEAPAYVLRALKEGRVSGAILFRENLNVAPGCAADGRHAAGGGRAGTGVRRPGGWRRAGDSVDRAGPDGAGAGELQHGRQRRASGGRSAARRRCDGDAGARRRPADLDGAAVGGRAFGREPARVQQAVAAAVKGWRAGGVAPTLKHFPGFGGAKTNTDDAPATIDRSAAQLRAVDLPPFKAGIAAGAPIVMLSHARYPALEQGRIASQSPAVLRLLRDELEFDGVAMTDSLEAAAVTAEPGGVGTAAIRSVEAGVDSILTTGRGSYIRVYRALLARAKRSAAFRRRVAESAARVETLLAGLGAR